MQDDTADDASGRERQRVQLLRQPTTTKPAAHVTQNNSINILDFHPGEQLLVTHTR